jgi:fatty-acyl-CoA synthase
MITELDWLKKWAEYSADSTALISGDTDEKLSYQNLYHRACAGADFLLQQHQIQPGDRVLLYATNEISSLILFFSCARLGATLVPINHRLAQREINYLINDAKPKIIIYEKQFLDNLINLQNEIDVPQGRWVDLESDFTRATLKSVRFPTQFKSEEETIALIIYTSGTTGFPKGAMISHRALFWNSINTGLRLNIVSTDAAVIFLPLFHTGGWNVLTTPFLHHGACIILTKKFDADQVLKLSDQYNCSLLFGVPTTMKMMSVSKLFDHSKLSSIRYAIVGGEPMPINEIEAWQNKKIPIRQGYGLTEFGPNVFSLNETDSIRKKGSIGFPNFYLKTKVVNDLGKDCESNEVGELWLKGPMMMSGYWNNAKATADTMSDEWLKTGDLVSFDDENYFYVKGRKKEMYKSGGENIYPAEIEKIILEIPWINEVAVIGVTDPTWGEVGHAFVSVKNGFAFDQNEIENYCKKQLAKFKVPRFFTALSDLPKGDSGKILKKNLSAPL